MFTTLYINITIYIQHERNHKKRSKSLKTKPIEMHHPGSRIENLLKETRF